MGITAVDVVLPCAIAFVSWRASILLYAYRAYGPSDLYPAFIPLSLPGVTFGMGLIWTWNRRPDGYGNKECIRITPLLWGYSTLYVRSPEVLRQVAGGGSNKTWIKPDWANGSLLLYGQNLATENLEGWRRHRRIMQPSFSRSTYELVWRETTRIYHDMVKTEGWNTQSGSIVSIKAINQLTFKLGLYVIGSCGFGLPEKFTWADPPKGEKGQGNIQSNIASVEKSSLTIQFAPKWIWKLPSKRLRTMWEEYTSLTSFIHTEVAQRKAIIDEALANGGDDALDSVNQDVFSRLVLASQSDGKQALSDSELIGNTFVLLFAGHDTTSSTLAAAIALLAYHTDEQDKAHQEIVKVIEENPQFDFSLSSQLSYITSIFLEAVRLYPAGEVGIRECLEDTMLRIPPSDEKSPPVDVAMPKGSTVVVDFIAMQYHSRQFADPLAFRPSRWAEVGEDSATAFSTGPRACIGKKFAQTEATCFLTNLLRDWRIEPLLNPGETKEQWKTRVLGKVKIVLTLTIADVPVRLVRR
ncbi:hypothetical protein M408DRAFT_331296 [Serendipita vermifera MAFF 305830]|uniref:Cytochrome P450 n=1 Tax=Serendipita vermifera MAFF 305830 TaxID=933852 RepID=A0A0C2WFK6_SERVB|nr:hypothetical protein M408DRAFT_331296 [Serendipita vermifera MAFF 305830]